MKSFQHIRRQHRSRRLAVIRPTRIEVNRTSLREALESPVQTKLRIGSTDDHLEHEADSVADRVLAMHDGPIQRKAADTVPIDEEERQRPGAENDQEEEVRRKAVPGTTATSADGQPLALGRGGGHPLPGRERAFFEPRLGTDLSRVRVHTDDAAARLAAGLSARAFTTGGEVYFGAGEYRPHSQEGRRLLAHELAHVVQQEQGREELKRKIDRITVKKSGIDLYFSLGLYGSRSSATLASKWASDIEKQWNRQLKLKGMTIDAKIHVTAKAYPLFADSRLMQAMVPESNAVFVEQNGFRSVVQYSGWGRDPWSTGRWAADAAPLVVAHEVGHMMGLDDKYIDVPSLGSIDLPGYETDIMANFWNDNGKTEFTRAWCGVLLYYFFGYRT